MFISGLLNLAVSADACPARYFRFRTSESRLEMESAAPPQDSVRHVRINISAKEIPMLSAPPTEAKPLRGHSSKKQRLRRSSRPTTLAAEKNLSPPSSQKQKISPVAQLAKADTINANNISSSEHSKPTEAGDHVSSLVYKLLAASVALLLLGLGCLAWLYRRKSQLNNELAAQNQEIKNETAIIERQSKSLEELNELKDKLFAIVSHDLRSPIGNLRAIMEMFQKEGMSVEQVSEILTEMVPSVENADMIISNLLNWAVNQRDGLTLKKTRLHYGTVIDETVRSFTYLLTAKKISVANMVNTESTVFADMDQVRIILRNLVSNAVKFVPVGGKIRFYTEECDECVVLAVEDNGRGLTREEVSNLFESNIHLSKEGTKGEKGAGIGLRLCKEMASLNDGKIYVESVPGESCTFYLKLPKSEVPEPIF